MPSTTEILRNACAANGLGTSGSSSVLLARLANASKKKPTNTKSMKPATQIKKATFNGKSKSNGKSNDESKGKRKVGRPPGSKNKPKPVVKGTPPVKGTKSGGVRLTAAHYFHKICGGRISECEPQMIMQPDNRKKLKEIRIVQGPHGPYPKWVLVK